MAKEKRPLQIEDTYKINALEDPQISPDGKWVAYVRVTMDKLENNYKRNIWLNTTDGGTPYQLTRSGKDTQPRWSPDGKTLAFTSARNDKPQVYLLPVDAPGGEPRSLTSMPNGANSPEWSPNGEQIAFLAPMNSADRAKEDAGEEIEPPQDKLDGKHRKERKAEDDKKRQDPYLMWRVPYRVGTSFVTDRFAQIYVISIDENLEDDAAKPRRLTDVDAHHDPAQWSPDGQYLYTHRQKDVTQDADWMYNWVYRIRIEDGHAEPISDDSHGSYSPLPSPDGKWIAYARMPRYGKSMKESITRLTVMPADGGESRDLNLKLDRSLIGMKWSRDGRTLFFNAGDRGDAPIYQVDVETGKLETRISGTFKSAGFDVGPNNEIAFAASTPVNPGELFWLAADATESETVTQFNQKWLDEVIVQETQEFWFTTPAGNKIQGWYILPVGYKEGQKYPLALNIHGGPRAMWGPSEHTMFFEWQFHAANDYFVFYCNPRGGDGYGEKFQQALHSAWGDVAFEDIMTGVDLMIEKGFVDESRMAVTGGSYGGYMTGWIVGHTDRFVSAVAQRGVYNLISFYGTSDVPGLITSDFDVDPWEDTDLLWKHSPLAYAQDVKTPLLIIHSENDYRVPIEQAEQFFAFIRRNGGIVEMLRYPRDGHELSRSGEPEHRVSRLSEMVAWFDKYCKPE
jgi:dipeptidyl aminopeptidase/acylaminoacyl peptidase